MHVEFKCYRRNAAATAALMRLKQEANAAIVEVLGLDPDDHPVNSLPCSFPCSDETGTVLNIRAEDLIYLGTDNPAQQIHAKIKARGGFGGAVATVNLRCRRDGRVEEFTAGSTRSLQPA